MKHNITFILLFLAFGLGYGQTTLAAGDIVITGFNSADTDEFTFVLLTDVEAGTIINFTDNGWFAIGGFRDNEGTVTWIADTSLICGTEIIIKDTDVILANSYSASTGTVTESNLGFALVAGAGDQILAYQGADITPVFIYAVNFDGAGWSDATSPNDSGLPTGLTDTINAVNLGPTQNAKYDCLITSDQALILAAVSTDSNWTLSNTVLTLGGCTYTCNVVCLGTAVEWIAGAWDNVIGPDINSDVTISDNYITNITNGSFSACNLTIGVGVRVTIADGYYVEVNNDLTVTGDITISSQGTFIQNNNAGVVTGTATVDKLTPPMNAWYEYTYWSSPVSGETIGNALSEADVNRRFSFDGSNFKDAYYETGNDNTQVFGGGFDDIDDDNNDWQPLIGGDTMIPGIGYASTHDQIFFNSIPGGLPKLPKYIFTGLLNNGNIPVTIYRNDEELADNNWNLLGNPYPSAISADLFLAVNTGIDGAIYLWSQNTAPASTNNGNQNSNFSIGDYAIINGTGTSAGGDLEIPNRFIPSGQGFFVTMSNSAPSTFHSDGDILILGEIVKTVVTFNNSMRVKGSTDNSQFFRVAGGKGKNNIANKNKLWVNLSSDNGVFSQAVIGYVSGATNDYDGSYYDATRNLSTGTSAIIYSNIVGSNKKFAIQGKAENSINEDEVISVGFKTSIDVPTIYTLSIAQFEGDFLNDNPVYIKDNLLNTSHNLKVSDYNFTSEVGEFNDRFEILFSEDALSLNDSLVNEKSLAIIEHENGDVQFKLNALNKIKTIKIIDLQGRVLYNFNVNSNDETFKLSNLSQAAYVAKVTLDNNQVITKKSIKRF